MTAIQSACVKYLMEIEHKHTQTLFVNSDKHEMEGRGKFEVFFFYVDILPEGVCTHIDRFVCSFIVITGLIM
jgi:hypothetical protein